MHRAVERKALSLVGQGYIYGAKGQTCSLAFRQQQAEQYPEQADNILTTGAKWDGKPVWDCAQLTRACAKAGGVEIASGATSQWSKTDWERYGSIDTLPENTTVFVFRRQSGSDSIMQHTGVALADGTCVHARGTAYGVVRQKLNEYPWTHWAVPVWKLEKEEGPMTSKATVTAPSGTVNMRVQPSRSANLVDRLPIGAVVEVTQEVRTQDGEQWRQIGYDGRTGWMMARYLLLQDDPSAAEDSAQNAQEEDENVTLTLPKSAAQALLEALRGAVEA